MAQVLGESGRYVSDAASRALRRMLNISLFVIGFAAFICGLAIRLSFPARIPSYISLVGLAIFLVAAWAVSRYTSRQIDKLADERKKLLRGADGEALVAYKLTSLPDDFRVINDLSTPFGNIDHVVIGPTGVFLLDTKNWRGTVDDDKKGELLCNGKPTDKPYVRNFTGRIMGIKDKVLTLAPGADPFYQPVFVFPSAHVQARWGSTRSVHCIRDDQLHDYIVDKKFGKRLTPTEVDRLSQAFLALAHMEKDFTAKSTPSPSS